MLTTDVFPDTVLNTFLPQNRLPTRDQFPRLRHNYDMTPYGIQVKANHCVSYSPLQWNALLRFQFWNELQSIHDTTQRPYLPWSVAVAVLKRPLSPRLYQRTFFRIQNAFFLTKKFFTFGQRTVQQGTFHLIQMGDCFLNLFIRERRCCRKRPKYFFDREETLYQRTVLLPNHIYSIPSGTVYILYSTSKSFFSVHILQNHVALPFQNVIPITF